MKKKKRSSKNLKIGTRITISAIVGILVPLMILVAFSSLFQTKIALYLSSPDFQNLLFSRAGLIILLIAAMFIISIIAVSFIMSKTISKPLKELSYGANEIANGNLDYVIDYDSTNEIGVTVKSFNHMTDQLKQLTERQHTIEQSRKEMIAGVAHDLRTPLTSVKGYVEGLMDGIANTPEKQQLYLKTIYTSTLNMERLLDELLTVSRLELGNIELDCKPININDFLDDCAEELRTELHELDFDFEYTNNCDGDFTVMIDTDRFQRVIRNIISNSVKYAKKDEKGKIEFAAQTYQKSVIITLADNGIGIEDENLSKIFESFYRADPARTKTSEGSGIGLSVARQIVELHGGKIWATGKEGKGLTILISLPRTEETNGK